MVKNIRVFLGKIPVVIIVSFSLLCSISGRGEQSEEDSQGLMKDIDASLANISNQITQFQKDGEAYIQKFETLKAKEQSVIDLMNRLKKNSSSEEQDKLNDKYNAANEDLKEFRKKIAAEYLRTVLVAFSCGKYSNTFGDMLRNKAPETIHELMKQCDSSSKDLHLSAMIDRSAFKIVPQSNIPQKICGFSNSSIQSGQFGKVIINDQFEQEFTPYSGAGDFKNNLSEDDDLINEEASSEATDKILNGIYAFCVLSARSGVTVNKPVLRTKELDDRLFSFTNFQTSGTDVGENFIELCTKRAPTEKQILSLKKLARFSPDINYLLPFVLKKKQVCNSVAQGVCKQSYIIKGQLIYTYSTVSCKTRKVTKADIEQDIQTWKNAGVEEAERLEHSQILDQINVCQAAVDAGYTWKPTLATVPKGCKPKP